MAKRKLKRDLTDLELSRTLSEHAIGRMRALGAPGWGRDEFGYVYPTSCIVQVIENEPCLEKFTELMRWFDIEYDRHWSSEEFLLKLENRNES